MEGDEITQEQAQQIAENFNALKDSLQEGKETIEGVQEKLEFVRNNQQWLSHGVHGQRLQAALSRIEAEGLNGKLQGAWDMLDQVEQGANTISDQAERIRTEYEKVAGFYEKWHPEPDNPVRPLILVANGLEELESIIQSIDPSPDNVLIAPIISIIGYYRAASTAFAESLGRLKQQIDERRENCIGVGCDASSGKARRFAAAFPGLGPAWLYRTIPEAEVWYEETGRAFLWRGELWQELSGGLQRFDEVWNGWLLAHGEIIGTENLVARINNRYELIVAARGRAQNYWDILQSTDACDIRRLTVLGDSRIPARDILAAAENSRERFIARYVFREDARRTADGLLEDFENTLLVEGFVTSPDNEDVSGAELRAQSPAGEAQARTDASGHFRLQLRLPPERGSTRNASVSVTHEGYADYQGEQRLWSQCEDWAISMQSGKDQAAEMQAMRELLDQVQSMSAALRDACDASGLGAPAPAGSAPDLEQLLQQIMELSADLYQGGEVIARHKGAVEEAALRSCESMQALNGVEDSLPEGRELYQQVEEGRNRLMQALEIIDAVDAEREDKLAQLESLERQLPLSAADRNGADQEQESEIRALEERADALRRSVEQGQVLLQDVRDRAAGGRNEAKAGLEQLAALQGEITQAASPALECVTAARTNYGGRQGEPEAGQAPGLNTGELERIGQVIADARASAGTAEVLSEGALDVARQAEQCYRMADVAFQQLLDRLASGSRDAGEALDRCDLEQAAALIPQVESPESRQVLNQRYENIRMAQEYGRSLLQSAHQNWEACAYAAARADLEAARDGSVCSADQEKYGRYAEEMGQVAADFRRAGELIHRAEQAAAQDKHAAAIVILKEADAFQLCDEQRAAIDGYLAELDRAMNAVDGDVAFRDCPANARTATDLLTGETYCDCHSGYVVDATGTACVPPGDNPEDLVMGIFEAINQSRQPQTTPPVTTMNTPQAQNPAPQTRTGTVDCAQYPDWCEKYERYRGYQNSIRSAPPDPYPQQTRQSQDAKTACSVYSSLMQGDDRVCYDFVDRKANGHEVHQIVNRARVAQGLFMPGNYQSRGTQDCGVLHQSLTGRCLSWENR